MIFYAQSASVTTSTSTNTNTSARASASTSANTSLRHKRKHKLEHKRKRNHKHKRKCKHKRKHKRKCKHNNSYITMKTALTQHKHERKRTHKDQFFSFSYNYAFACVCAATNKDEIPLRHNTSRRTFTTSGYIWPMKTLDPDYHAHNQFSKMTEGSDDLCLSVSNFVFTWVIPNVCVCACASVAKTRLLLQPKTV